MENVNFAPLASLATGVKMYADPVITEVGGVPEMIGGPLVV
jgi:hypothetical protein